MSEAPENQYDVIVIGGGQAGLAVGYYLRRSGLRYSILDAQREPGGAWLHGWRSLRLFSPAQWSSLPGWLMPGGTERYPTRDEVLDYLRQYEERYELPVGRPVNVTAVRREGEGFVLDTDAGEFRSRAVVSATGTWQRPFIPEYPGREMFEGVQIHSANYDAPDRFAGRRVLIVGGGNSGAQILAEIAPVAEATWVTLEEPIFLPDDVDGRVLFDAASKRYKELTSGAAGEPQGSYNLLGSIVMVEPVRRARDLGLLVTRRPFTRFTREGVIWNEGESAQSIDAVIWCTGFRSAIDHLRPLDVIEPDGRVKVSRNRSEKEPNLWLVGYGNWTGFASATLIGVGRTARATVDEIVKKLK